MDINNLVIAGRLTKDPELRYTPNGDAVTSITVAVNRSFTNQQGEREADFINCVVWKRRAEAVANHFKKGDEIGGTGRIQTRSFEGQDGKRVFVTEVVLESFTFGQKKGDTGRQGNPGPNTSGSNQNGNTGRNGSRGGDPFAGQGGQIDISDDDLPF